MGEGERCGERRRVEEGLKREREERERGRREGDRKKKGVWGGVGKMRTLLSHHQEMQIKILP